MKIKNVLAVFAVLSLCAPIVAVSPRSARDSRTISVRRAVALKAPAQDDGGFLGRRGGEWELSIDPRTGLATLVQGSGVPLVPGRGNGLAPEALAGLPMPDGEITLDTLEPLVRGFLLEERALVGPPVGRLALDRARSVGRDDGRLWTLRFEWLVDDVPVEEAGVFVRLNSGNITQFGAPLVGPLVIDTRPAIDEATAVRALLAYSGDEELARVVGEPSLLIQSSDDSGVLHRRLVWSVRYRVPGRVETWEGRVDAVTGEVVGFRDVNAYGRSRGGIFPRTVVDSEISAPFPFTDVTIDGATVTSDSSGGFLYQGGQARSSLAGRFFRTSCSDGCSAPAQTVLSRDLGSGVFHFGFGGADGVGNGVSNKAERNAFYHLNQVRRVGKKWLPALGWLDGTVGVNVNIADTCNAFWNGTANFYRSGGGCNNTGEISDVMHHEWGHGLDGNTNGGDGATGEATADIVAMHMTHDAEVGPYFRTDGRPVRDLDRLNNTRGLLTTGNLLQKCPAGSGPLGGEVHCEGEIYGQAHWDLSRSMIQKHGNHTGWRELERIFFSSLPDVDGYLATNAESAYDAYINADDDDGNLVNGTPNGDEIFQAFDLHGIAGAAVGTSAGCLRPAQSTLTANASCGSVDLSWNAVAGIDRYEVLRADVLEDTAYLPVATVASGTTSFSDAEVAPDTDYFYVVMSVAADGCESTVENPVLARLDPQPLLSLSAAVADDVPRGNRSGFADPGEDVDLVLTLENYGSLAASAIDGMLTAVTPGVTVLEDLDSWPDLVAGASSANQGVLRFQTDEAQLACGDTARFRLQLTDASSCGSEDSYLDVTLGTRIELFADDFETDQGWFWDAAASTATAGHWVLGDPDGTSFQPEDDTTANPGTLCWFTAPNPGGDGTDDVDDGVTVLVSPAIDLSGQTTAILTYQRWFNNRDLGEDGGDFFAADISSDDGATWVNLETLGTDRSAPAWTPVEFRLEDFIPLTGAVRVRFQVADGPATGNLIEAAIDDVFIERPECDDTPACFIEPTFAGLDSAVPGSSCAEAELAWQPASTNCQNATITYSVYRSTTSGFTPDASTRVAAGLVGTAFSDSLLDPGVTYHYIVRAHDSRSGEDSNLVELSVVAPTSPDIAAPVFSGLETATGGSSCGETVLGWSPALETCNAPVAYEIYRSTDPAFVPAPANRIGSSLSNSYVDAALAPGTVYTYVVRARDEAGNEDANDVRLTVEATILDAELLVEEFEPDDGGWSAVAPDDATTGNWEWGDPDGTSYQPEDDFTAAAGVNAWITGLSAAGGGGGNDVDGGTTTLLSTSYDLSAAVAPVVRYARWFTNDQGGAPGEDPFDVEVSNDDGATWTLLEQVGSGTPLQWVEVQFDLSSVITPTSQMRFRFTARDLGSGGSLVEAGIDGFDLLDRDQGCNGCGTPVGAVQTILVERQADDIVLDWSADPAAGGRFAVYKLSGPDLGEQTRIGTTTTRSFVHEGAALSTEDFRYRVSAVDDCGNESTLD